MSTCGEDLDEDVRVCTERRDRGFERCTEWGERTRRECEQRETRRRRECEEWGTERRRECDNWGILGAVCAAFVWVTERVCQAYTTIEETVCTAWTEVTERFCRATEWVENIVCVSWAYVSTGICFAIDAVSTVLVVAMEILASSILFVLDMLAALALQILRIPIIGRVLAVIHSFVTEVINRLASAVVDGALELLGIRPEKRMRVCVLVPEQFSESTDDVVDQLQVAVDTFRDEANVRILPTNVHGDDKTLFDFRTPFADHETVDESWINHVDIQNDNVENVACGVEGFLEDTAGQRDFGRFDITCIRGSTRKLIGYGAPVKIVYVGSHTGGSVGCSFSGFLSDFVTVNNPDAANPPEPDTTAHELGHHCGLPHTDSPPNLMHTPANARTGQNLTRLQTVAVRNAKSVTFF
jgi:hypothetical protein